MNNHQLLIAAIRQRWEPSCGRCGRLIQKRGGMIIDWHYSVALSDEWAIAWGPERPGPVGEGCLTIHKLTSEFTDAHSVPYLSLSDIYDNLLASVIAFHARWRYGIQGWNCEHWARLVVTGEAMSYRFVEYSICFIRSDATEAQRRT
jgi:hypothetical protein